MKTNRITMLVLFMALIAMVTFAAAAEDMPEPEGEAFWTYISETNPYTKWDMWPGEENMIPGTSPHGAFLKLYVNDAAMKALKENQSMPDGAIIVKENYGEDKDKLMSVTPMYRKEGYNPDNGDWFWAKYGPEGEVMESGKVDGCLQCHKTQKDWLFNEAK